MSDTLAVQTKREDTSVKLPSAVVRASQRAEELSSQFRAQGNVTDKPHEEGAPPTQAPPTQAPPKQVSSSQTNSEQQSNTYSEQQFKSIQGRFEKAELEKKQLLDRLNETQRLLAYMNAPTIPSEGSSDTRFNNPISPAARHTIQSLITEKERNEYGEELIDVIRRAAKETYDPIINELRFENEQLKRAVGGVQQNVALDARGRLFQDLSREVPDWEAINNDDGFKNWANQIDPLSGNTRFNLIRDAFNTGQTSRVVAAFKGYKSELAALSPAQDQRSQSGNGAVRSENNLDNANPNNSRSNAATTPAVDLNALVAPGRARSGQVPSSPDKPTVERQEISQFYKDVTLGKYRGREQEQQAIERQIGEALKEGRVR